MLKGNREILKQSANVDIVFKFYEVGNDNV